MAHALKRISYAASDPENNQFSLLAREPKGRTDVQYCHAFRTFDSREVSMDLCVGLYIGSGVGSGVV